MEEELVMIKKLDSLKIQHRELDGMINKLSDERNWDDFELNMLKRKKLRLRDEMNNIEREIYPDDAA